MAFRIGSMGSGDQMIDHSFWSQRQVFMTGNTGFKGSWLSAWLLKMNCRVEGYSLAPTSENSMFDRIGLGDRMRTHLADIRDANALKKAVRASRPDVIFHLAAQPLVRLSYKEPVGTFATNVMGTVNLLEAARETSSVKAIVVITSDKCYANSGRPSAYLESDSMGGDDPYSASKGCSELVCASYRKSFFRNVGIGLATARAGNVIGGGDYSADRILPDAVRAFERDECLRLRNPSAVRPWQHVLEPLAGYLKLAEQLFFKPQEYSEAWNFGPIQERAVTVSELVEKASRAWGAGRWESSSHGNGPHEAAYLTLDSGKARAQLGWTPKLSLNEGVQMAVEWYRKAGGQTSIQEMAAACNAQISAYESAGFEAKLK